MQSSVAHTALVPPSPTYIPPLDIARNLARLALDEANALDIDTADSAAVARQFDGICVSLRHVLAALDAEDGRHA